MQPLFLTTALALVVPLLACGSTPHPASASGLWSAALSTSGTGQPETFTFNLIQNDSTFFAENLKFSGTGNISQCFGRGTTLSGSLTSPVNGGPMTITLSWIPRGGTVPNTLSMQGNMATSMTSGSGTFTIIGQISGCANQSGTFTMSRAPAHSMVTNP